MYSVAYTLSYDQGSEDDKTGLLLIENRKKISKQKKINRMTERVFAMRTLEWLITL